MKNGFFKITDNNSVSPQIVQDEELFISKIEQAKKELDGVWGLVDFTINGVKWLNDDSEGMIFFNHHAHTMSVGIVNTLINNSERIEGILKQNIEHFLQQQSELLSNQIQQIFLDVFQQQKSQSLGKKLHQVSQWCLENTEALSIFEQELLESAPLLKQQYEHFFTNNLKLLLKQGSKRMEQCFGDFFIQFLNNTLKDKINLDPLLLEKISERLKQEFVKQIMAGLPTGVFPRILYYGGPWDVLVDENGQLISQHTVQFASSPKRLIRGIEQRKLFLSENNTRLTLIGVIPVTGQEAKLVYDKKPLVTAAQTIVPKLCGVWSLVNKNNNNDSNEGLIEFTSNGYVSFGYNDSEISRLKEEPQYHLDILEKILFFNGSYDCNLLEKEKQIVCNIDTSSDIQLRKQGKLNVQVDQNANEFTLSFDIGLKHYSWQLKKVIVNARLSSRNKELHPEDDDNAVLTKAGETASPNIKI